MSLFGSLFKAVGGGLASLLGISTGPSQAAQDAALKAKQDADAAAKAAADQAAATAKQAEADKLALSNMQSNSLALSNANAASTDQGQLANVVAGGFADAQDTTKKRRVAAPTLASTLGINI